MLNLRERERVVERERDVILVLDHAAAAEVDMACAINCKSSWVKNKKKEIENESDDKVKKQTHIIALNILAS